MSAHGKCRTGTTKKELLGSAMPASALYHAKKAARMPKAPPARKQPVFGSPPDGCRYATPRKRKVRSSVKNSRKNATVDFKVQMSKMKVKMNQP